MDDSNQDPYALFPEFCRISISQQHLLESTPLVGYTNHHHDTPEEDSLLPSSDIDVVDGGGVVEEFRVLERDISDLGQVPVKKLKLGFDSLGCEQVNVHAAVNRETPIVENSVLEENVEIQDAEAVAEGSGLLEDQVLRMLQKELESGKDKGKQTFSVFDVLKVLSDDNSNEDGDGLTVLEAAKLAGITFPRPSWWPDHYVSELFNFDDDDQVESILCLYLRLCFDINP